jgi:hypothetical protein
MILSSRFDVDGASAILFGLQDRSASKMIGRWSARSILHQDAVFSQSHFFYQSQYQFPGRKTKNRKNSAVGRSAERNMAGNDNDQRHGQVTNNQWFSASARLISSAIS